jgi:type VI secretion system secreted protein Hcp
MRFEQTLAARRRGAVATGVRFYGVTRLSAPLRLRDAICWEASPCRAGYEVNRADEPAWFRPSNRVSLGACGDGRHFRRGRALVASDIFAKLGDIKGESLDSKHKDEIEVLSWSWGVVNPRPTSRGSGGGAGKPTFHDLSFTHNIDKASPLLMRGCATGQHLKEATITHRKAGKGQQEFLIIKMNDVIVTGVTAGDSENSHLETVSIAFAKVDLEYRPQKQDGSLDAGVHFKYDLKTNKEG